MNYVNTNNARLNVNKDEENEKQPDFATYANSTSQYLSAKNYELRQHVSIYIKTYEGLTKSQRFNKWQPNYTVLVNNNEEKIWTMSPKIAKVLLDTLHIEQFDGVVGKTLELIVLPAMSGTKTFELVGVK